MSEGGQNEMVGRGTCGRRGEEGTAQETEQEERGKTTIRGWCGYNDDGGGAMCVN